MNRTIISPTRKKQTQQHESPNKVSSVLCNKTVSPIVASLPVDKARPNHPYSSLALSPKGRYAIVAGKDTIQLVSVGPDGLKRLRSFKIAHQFYSAEASKQQQQTTVASTGSAGHSFYEDFRDAFQLSAETRASAVTAGVANMNLNRQFGNVSVTKVAWSNNYCSNQNSRLSTTIRGYHLSQRGSMRGLDPSIDDSSLSATTLNTEPNEGRRRKQNQPQSSSFRQNQNDTEDGERVDDSENDETMVEDESLVAAAGSNGVVVVWSAKRLLFSEQYGVQNTGGTKGGGGLGERFSIGGKSSASASAAMPAKQQRAQQPEGILNQHTRAVNGMAWHPTISGLLLTASQDGSMKLWERQVLTKPDHLPEADGKDQQRPSWFSMVGGVVSGTATASGRGSATGDHKKYAWRCKATFSLGEQEAVRDVRWNPLLSDIFGVVTANGNLVVYNMHITVRALVKIAAHTGDAASLDWHPRWPYIVATGGSGDRFVKIWDLESSLDPYVNGGAAPPKRNNPRKEINQFHQESTNTIGTTKSDTSSFSGASNESTHSSLGISSLSSVGNPITPTLRSTPLVWPSSGRHAHKSTNTGFSSKHVLSVSASVTQVRWRPPSNDMLPASKNNRIAERKKDDSKVKQDIMEDRHDSMLAVVTSRLTSAGGSGTLSLWSFNRPFMSLSIVEGHKEGPISDFAWIRTPIIIPTQDFRESTLDQKQQFRGQEQSQQPKTNVHKFASESSLSAMTSSQRIRMKSIDYSERTIGEDDEGPGESVSYIWQNVLSVGRDGQCIMQSFARGERRIHHVPSSCFAMANLSPFQKGYGSLQFFSVHQSVPNRQEDDFMLTGLRQDKYTAHAPGIFREDDLQIVNSTELKASADKFPASIPELRFSVVDQGRLDANGMPIANDPGGICIAPEVLHLSRFARLYKMYPDEECSSRVDLCRYNSKVAEELQCGSLARMWGTVSSLLHGSGLNELPSQNSAVPTNAFQFVILPTMKALLLERAEAGDVQTNVALCEVLQVVDSDGEQTRIPGLSLRQVREWYLSYIDLLHQMCLFSAAAFLIKHCKDPVIGAMSQQSTTIHESCPRCGKPLDSTADSSENNVDSSGAVRQVCKNCRRRVAMCFICHEPVQGVFVWCPGCGHGGHLEHALQWFGGLGGKAVRTVCPTGCGHKCNFVEMATTFPRTMSMVLSDSSPMEPSSVVIPGHQPRCIPVASSLP